MHHQLGGAATMPMGGLARHRSFREFEQVVPHDGQGNGLAEVGPVKAQRLDDVFPVLLAVVAE